MSTGKDEKISLHQQRQPDQPLDIEAIVQWALTQPGCLPWRGISDKALAYDHGWTARPRHISGLGYRGAPLLLPRVIGDEAVAVIEAIKALPAADAAVVLACGRSGIRPDWMPGVEPVQVFRKTRSGSRHRRKRVTVAEWKPCSPATLSAAHAAYSAWHQALSSLARQLGCLAPLVVAEPWLVAMA